MAPQVFPAADPAWGICCILRSGGAWRLLGVWKYIHTALRELVRLRMGRHSTPSAAMIDRQSVRTTEAGGPRGYDGGKKINGRKRHLLVDTLGLVMAINVQQAVLQDRAGAPLLLNGLGTVVPRKRHVWADAGYTGKLGDAVQTVLGWTLEIVKHSWSGNLIAWAPINQPPPPIEVPVGFVVLKRRWVVERTFAWLGKSRRMSRDFEALPATSEHLAYQIMIRLMLRRLARMTA